MNQTLKRTALTFVSSLFVLFASGCESLDTVAAAQADGDATDLVYTSRSQVVAELREAQRLGVIPEGEAEVPTLTAGQARQIAQAGERAAGGSVAQK